MFLLQAVPIGQAQGEFFDGAQAISRGLDDHLGAIPESEATTDQNFSVELRTARLAIG